MEDFKQHTPEGIAAGIEELGMAIAEVGFMVSDCNLTRQDLDDAMHQFEQAAQTP